MNITIVAAGSKGDVYPSIALGLGFKTAGYKVSLAANIIFEAEIKSYGLGFFPIKALFRHSLKMLEKPRWASVWVSSQ